MPLDSMNEGTQNVDSSFESSDLEGGYHRGQLQSQKGALHNEPYLRLRPRGRALPAKEWVVRAPQSPPLGLPPRRGPGAEGGLVAFLWREGRLSFSDGGRAVTAQGWDSAHQHTRLVSAPDRREQEGRGRSPAFRASSCDATPAAAGQASPRRHLPASLRVLLELLAVSQTGFREEQGGGLQEREPGRCGAWVEC